MSDEKKQPYRAYGDRIRKMREALPGAPTREEVVKPSELSLRTIARVEDGDRAPENRMSRRYEAFLRNPKNVATVESVQSSKVNMDIRRAYDRLTDPKWALVRVAASRGRGDIAAYFGTMRDAPGDGSLEDWFSHYLDILADPDLLKAEMEDEEEARKTAPAPTPKAKSRK